MEANRLIGGVLSRHEGDAAGAIQELFQLLGEVDESLHEPIKIAILFALQSLHEWNNLLKYLQRWNLSTHRKKVLERMRHRLNDHEVTTNEEQVELERLVNKYWLVRSPKKEERNYREPILLNNMLRHLGKSEGGKEYKTKDKEEYEKKEKQRELVKKVEKSKEEEINKEKSKDLDIQKKEGDKNDSASQQIRAIDKKWDENSNKEQERLQRQKDPLTKVTGRPPILKKSSIIDNTRPQKREHKSFNIPSNDVVQLIINYNRKKQSQLQQQQKQATLDKPIETSSQNQLRPLDEKLPPEKFNFGSSKKSKNAELLRKIPVSPKKYQPQRKVIRIKREEPRPQERPIEVKSSLDFSFCKDSDPLPSSQPNHGGQNNLEPFRISPFKFKEVPASEYKEIPKVTISRESMNQRESLLGDDPTPMFVFNQDSRSRHSVKQAKWLSDEQMKLLEPGQYKDMLGKLRRSQGLTAARILNEFLKI